MGVIVGMYDLKIEITYLKLIASMSGVNSELGDFFLNEVLDLLTVKSKRKCAELILHTYHHEQLLHQLGGLFQKLTQMYLRAEITPH